MTYKIVFNSGSLTPGIVACGLRNMEIAEKFAMAAISAGAKGIRIEEEDSQKDEKGSPISSNKYELTEETVKTPQGTILHRIRALKDFVCQDFQVRKGDLGGYVESEKNLSQEDNCWVSGNAWVYGTALVFGDALVFGNAWVYGTARVFGGAWVSGYALVSGNARVFGTARVFETAWVFGNAWVYGNARVDGNALVFEGELKE